jgi:hypothetical protein
MSLQHHSLQLPQPTPQSEPPMLHRHHQPHQPHPTQYPIPDPVPEASLSTAFQYHLLMHQSLSQSLIHHILHLEDAKTSVQSPVIFKLLQLLDSNVFVSTALIAIKFPTFFLHYSPPAVISNYSSVYSTLEAPAAKLVALSPLWVEIGAESLPSQLEMNLSTKD